MLPDELNKLIADINDHIPDHTWSLVKDTAIATIVDSMTSDVLIKMAEMSLAEYYHEHQDKLIEDLISLVGLDNAVHMLDSLQLDKVPQPKEE